MDATALTKLRFAVALYEAFHVSYVSRQMGFGPTNPGLLLTHWIWRMNHCQLDV